MLTESVMSAILSIILYVIYVLVPMIPAIFIYRLFPADRIGVSGILANLKINATGAFAAYVITVTLGSPLILKIQKQITQISSPTWTIKAMVDLKDRDGNDVNNPDLLETLNIVTFPDINSHTGNMVLVKLPGDRSLWPQKILKLEIPHFGSQNLNVGDISKDAYIDDYNLLLDVKKPVTIQATAGIVSEGYHPDKTVLNPVPNFGPPVQKSEP